MIEMRFTRSAASNRRSNVAARNQRRASRPVNSRCQTGGDASQISTRETRLGPAEGRVKSVLTRAVTICPNAS